MLVRDVLVAKGGDVFTIQSTQTLRIALRLLITKRIGALLVFNESNQMVGILSERDILGECHKNPTGWFRLHVSDIMNHMIRTVSPEVDLKVVMEMMTENRIRHIPVLEAQKLVGIISIGDVVKARLQHAEHENEHMRNYIHGT